MSQAVERRAVGDAAVLDRPFQAVAVGIAADRKGRRQPGEQLAQGRGRQGGRGQAVSHPAGRRARGGRCGRAGRRHHGRDVVIMIGVAVGIGAAFGVEGGVDVRHDRAEMADHVLDDRIVADAQAVAEELGRQMAVAEVPGDAEQVVGRRRGDLGERLGAAASTATMRPSSSTSPSPSLSGTAWARSSRNSSPLRRGHGDAAAVPLIVVEHDAVGGLAGPLPGGVNAGSADHRAAIWLIGSSRDTTGGAPRQTAKAMHGILFDKDGTLLDFEATWLPLLRLVARDLAHGDDEVAEAMLVKGGLDPETGRFRAGSTIAAGTSVDVARLWYPTLDGDALATIVTRIDDGFRGRWARPFGDAAGRDRDARGAGGARAMFWASPPMTARRRRRERSKRSASGASSRMCWATTRSTIPSRRPTWCWPSRRRPASSRRKSSWSATMPTTGHGAPAGAGAAIGVLSAATARQPIWRRLPMRCCPRSATCPAWLAEHG